MSKIFSWEELKEIFFFSHFGREMKEIKGEEKVYVNPKNKQE